MRRSEPRSPATGKTRRRFRMRELTILMSVILAVVVFGALNRQFLDVETAITILENAAPDGLIVIGMSIVIICGAFDMSVGSAMAVCGLVAALCMNKAHLPSRWPCWPPWPRGRDRLDQRQPRHPAGDQPLHYHSGHDEHSAGDCAGRHAERAADRISREFPELAWGTVFTLHLPRTG